MANVAADHRKLAAPVKRSLGALRRSMIFWVLIDGIAWLFGAVAVWAAFSILVDYTFHLDVPQRAILLFVGLALAAWFIWRGLVRPFLETPNDDALCLEVERKHQSLGERLISAWQFSQTEQTSGVSQEMVDATIDEGVVAAKSLSFASSLNRQRLAINVLVVLAVLAFFVGGGILLGAEMSKTWANRNLLLQDDMWPQETYFIIQGLREDGSVAVPRGENWEAVVLVDEERSLVIPGENDVSMQFRPSGGRPVKELTQSKQNPLRYSTKLPSIHEEFEFRVVSHRSSSKWYPIVLLEQPHVENLRIEVTPPAYIGTKVETLPSDAGPYSVLRGSKIRITGGSTKSLSKAELVFSDPRRPDVWATKELTLVSDDEFEIDLGENWLGYETDDSTDGPTDDSTTEAEDEASDKPAAETKGAPRDAARLSIELTDESGLKSRRPTSFTIRVQTDRAPRVRLALMGIGGMVTTKALLPFRSQMDDDYQITKGHLSAEWREGDAPQTALIDFEQLVEGLPKKQFEFIDAIELEELKIPIDSSLTLKMLAEDNDNVSGPNVGASNEILLRVVSEKELREDLLRREMEQRQEFARLHKEQVEIQTESAALAADSAEAEKLSTAQRQKLMDLQRKQRLIATNADIIAQRLSQHLLEIANNRLEEEDGPLQRNLGEKIIAPMRDIADLQIPDAVAMLDKTRRHSQMAERRNQAFDEVSDKHALIVQTMEEILAVMAKVEGYQEAINLLYEIEKKQKGVFELTQKEREERIRRLIGGDPPSEESPDEGESPEKNPDEIKEDDDSSDQAPKEGDPSE